MSILARSMARSCSQPVNHNAVQIGDPVNQNDASLARLGSPIDHFRPLPNRDRPLDGSRHFRRCFCLSEAIAQTPAKQGHFSRWPHRLPRSRAVNQRRPHMFRLEVFGRNTGQSDDVVLVPDFADAAEKRPSVRPVPLAEFGLLGHSRVTNTQGRSKTAVNGRRVHGTKDFKVLLLMEDPWKFAECKVGDISVRAGFGQPEAIKQAGQRGIPLFRRLPTEVENGSVAREIGNIADRSPIGNIGEQPCCEPWPPTTPHGPWSTTFEGKPAWIWPHGQIPPSNLKSSADGSYRGVGVSFGFDLTGAAATSAPARLGPESSCR